MQELPFEVCLDFLICSVTEQNFCCIVTAAAKPCGQVHTIYIIDAMHAYAHCTDTIMDHHGSSLIQRCIIAKVCSTAVQVATKQMS